MRYALIPAEPKRRKTEHVYVNENERRLKRDLDAAQQEIKRLTCILHQTEERLDQKVQTIRFYRYFAKEHRHLQQQLATATKRAECLESTQKGGERKRECDVPTFHEDDELLSDEHFLGFMKTFTSLMSHKRKKPITALQFVTVIYAPYFDEAFGKCYVPRIDEILDECHFDEVTEKVTCSLKAARIKEYFLQYASVSHFQEIYKRFEHFKQTSYVKQRLWDMGYHQAKDIIQGFEKHNVSYLNQVDGVWKGIIFNVEKGRCFVSGESQKGVGDHIVPVRANRHVTGCYGGNSKWNLASVISALNQPYKNMILFVPQQNTFVKICLDNATFTNISFDDFDFQAKNAMETFDEYYRQKQEQLVQTPRVNCLVLRRNFYIHERNVLEHKDAILVKTSDHFYEIVTDALDSSVSVDVLKSIIALPRCSQNSHIPLFVVRLKEQKAIMDLLRERISLAHLSPGKIVGCLFRDAREQYSSDVQDVVAKQFPELSGPDWPGIKKVLAMFWDVCGLSEAIRFLNTSNSTKYIKWMQIKEDKGLYRRSDALNIYMRLHLWKKYVQSVKRPNTPKMEWKMNPKDLGIIEEILKQGVQDIHGGTQDFIKKST